MDIKEYQDNAITTALFKDDDQALDCVIAGLMGELGEVMELWKKYRREDYTHQDISDLKAFETFQHQTALELGDLMWYIAVYAHLWNIDLGWSLEENLLKLRKRFDNGTLHSNKEGRYETETEQ